MPGKRNAIDVGLAECTGDIVVLVDSDTIWTTDTLRELVKPFADARDRRRHHQPADHRPGPQRAHAVGRLAGEHPRRVLDARDERARPGRMPARPHDRVPAPGARRRDARRSSRTGSSACSSRSATTARSRTCASSRATRPCTSRRAASTPTRPSACARWPSSSSAGRAAVSTTRCGCCPWMMRNTPMLALFYVTDIIMPFLLLACASGFVVRAAARRERELLRGDHLRVRRRGRHHDHRRPHAAWPRGSPSTSARRATSRTTRAT